MIRAFGKKEEVCCAAGLLACRSFLANALMKQCQAFPARHRGVILRGDPFHFRPMSRFLVARITQHHAVRVESVEVTLVSSISGHGPYSKIFPILLALNMN